MARFVQFKTWDPPHHHPFVVDADEVIAIVPAGGAGGQRLLVNGHTKLIELVADEKLSDIITKLKTAT